MTIAAPQTLSIGLGALAVSQIDYRLLLLAMFIVMGGCGVWLFLSRPEDREEGVVEGRARGQALVEAGEGW